MTQVEIPDQIPLYVASGTLIRWKPGDRVVAHLGLNMHPWYTVMGCLTDSNEVEISRKLAKHLDITLCTACFRALAAHTNERARNEVFDTADPSI